MPSGMSQLRGTLGLAQVTVPAEQPRKCHLLDPFRPSKGTCSTSLSTISSPAVTTLLQSDVVALPDAYLSGIFSSFMANRVQPHSRALPRSPQSLRSSGMWLPQSRSPHAPGPL